MSGEPVIRAEIHYPLVVDQEGREVVARDPADPLVLVQDPHNLARSIAVPRSQLRLPEPTPPRALTPRAGMDPGAQRIAAAGVGLGAAGCGVGAAAYGVGHLVAAAGQFVASLSGAGSVLGSAAVLAAVWKLAPTPRKASRVVNVTTNNRWWGRSNTTVK
ncbi:MULTISPECIES: hypothetical protein [unclassified Streptomyces]|uniref:hypothetical protein n=1 Tax=unclassified Streptomyces TaxID=2593676 RepID=UPI0033231055